MSGAPFLVWFRQDLRLSDNPAVTAAKKIGVKLTHRRLEIFREVAASLAHPDAETVLRGVPARMPRVSLDTLYRTPWMRNDLRLTAMSCARRIQRPL